MIGKDEVERFERDLCDFSASRRANAVAELAELVESGKVFVERSGAAHNLHCHTFYSYNGYGFSPERVAWMARKRGFFAAGTVDFDVLDAVDEFLAAAKMLDVRGVCGLESRVFVPELAGVEINSPGEVGIAYNMGCGFTSSAVPPEAEAFAAELRQKAADRTRNMAEKVNAFLEETAIDFEADAVKLTPRGNVTERHLCQAYREKAEAVFPDPDRRAAYWAEKLGVEADKARSLVDDPVKLEGAIRSKTMKRGGVGYVLPNPENFPTLESMNRFSRQCGALPSVAWLNGLSAGESDPDKLLDCHVANGAEVFNFVPDRNWNTADPEKQKRLVSEMDRAIASAIRHGMPVCVGTELNAPGLKLVDDFDSPFLSKYTETFVDGAAAVYAHGVMQKRLGRGMLSDWAKKTFSGKGERNAFYSALGRMLHPGNEDELEELAGKAMKK